MCLLLISIIVSLVIMAYYGLHMFKNDNDYTYI